jgi:hypothetical protein
MFGYRILAGFKGAGFLAIKMIFPVEPFQAGMQKPHPSQKNREECGTLHANHPKRII